MLGSSDEFEKIARGAYSNRSREIVSFSNHPDNDKDVERVMQMITEAGGVREIWKPILFGIVTNVEDYWLDEEIRRQLKTTIEHEQKVTWLATNGSTFVYGWNNQKPFRADIDLTEFPEGFAVHDCIRVEARGAFVTRIARVGIQDIKDSLGQ